MTPRLFFHVWSIETRSALSYRVDFWLNVIAEFAAQFAIVYFLWQYVFDSRGVERIAGYTFHGMITYYLTVILLGKLVRGKGFEGAVSADIYEGGLNRYLVFPAPYFPIKFAQHLGTMMPALVQFVLFGTLAVAFVGFPAEAAPTVGSVAMAMVAVAIANLLHFTLSFPIHAVAFWADNVWSLEIAKRFLTTLLGGAMLPLEVFPASMQQVLYWLPFRFFFHFPAKVFVGHVSVSEWAIGIGLAIAWGCLFGWACRAIWRRGRLKYTGVGI